MDQKSLIHPLTVGDLVQSALVLTQVERGDGIELHLLEVMSVNRNGNHFLDVTFRDLQSASNDWPTITLDPDTPILVTGISL